LKQLRQNHKNDAKLVAPFTGAWIETAAERDADEGLRVAPFTGAWIETPYRCTAAWPYHVAPFTGAWIETVLITHVD